MTAGSAAPRTGSRWPTRAFLMIALLAVAARGGFWWQVRELPGVQRPVMDAQLYQQLGRAIAAGEAPPAAELQDPLYPHFLATVYRLGGGDVTVRQLHLGASVLTVLLLVAATAQLFGSPAAIAAGALAALYAPAVVFVPLLLKPSLQLLFLAAFLAALATARKTGRGGWWWAAGAALGAAGSLGGNLLILVPAVILWIAAGDLTPEDPREPSPGWRRRGRTAAAFGVGIAVALSPFAVASLRAGHGPLPLGAHGGMNLWIGNGPGATGVYRPLAGGSQHTEKMHVDAARLAGSLDPGAAGEGLPDPRETSRILLRETLTWIAGHPLEWSRLMAHKLWLFTGDYEMPEAESFDLYREASPLLRLGLGFGATAPWALVGLSLLWARGRPEGRLLTLLLVAATLGCVLFFFLGRYRLALAPFLLPAAGYGLAEAAALARARRRRPLTAIAALLAAGLVFTFWPRFTPAERGAFRFAAEYAQGRAARELVADLSKAIDETGPETEGRDVLAHLLRISAAGEERLRRAVASNPGQWTAGVELAVLLNHTGNALSSAGHPGEASERYRRAREALARTPVPPPTEEDPDGPAQATELVRVIEANLGRSLANHGAGELARGEVAAAEDALRQAALLRPDEPLVWFNLGLCALAREAEESSPRDPGSNPRAPAAYLEAAADAFATARRLAAGSGDAETMARSEAGLRRVEELRTPASPAPE